MNVTNKSFSLVLFLLIFFLTTTPLTFAGGGPLDIEAWPLQPFAQTKTYIVASKIHAPQCDNIDVKASLLHPQKDDSVTSFTPPAEDHSFFEPHYFTDSPENTWNKICMKYFQVKSASKELRTAELEATINGEVKKVDYQLAFGEDENSKQLQSFGRVNDYDNSPQVDVISQTSSDETNQKVQIQWQQIAGAERYRVFAKALHPDGTTQSPMIVKTLSMTLQTLSQTHTEITLPNNQDYYLGVIACRPVDSCDQPKENMYEILLPRVSEKLTNITPLPQVIAKQTTTEQDKIDALNKKVAALEGKLDESNKKQTILEEKLDQLLTFIRSLFPNFK